MNKTKNLILKVLRENRDLESNSIRMKLEESGKIISYDTISKNLKQMTEEGLLIREAKGKPWNYYYNLNKDYNKNETKI